MATGSDLLKNPATLTQVLHALNQEHQKFEPRAFDVEILSASKATDVTYVYDVVLEPKPTRGCLCGVRPPASKVRIFYKVDEKGTKEPQTSVECLA